LRGPFFAKNIRTYLFSSRAGELHSFLLQSPENKRNSSVFSGSILGEFIIDWEIKYLESLKEKSEMKIFSFAKESASKKKEEKKRAWVFAVILRKSTSLYLYYELFV
jgi:hypothetical protein